ncbi:hypothetical protein [Desulfogranum marinum]|uniref:esterase/lipase family protein n=1 Tax=Desulfogranum marinum TaxID=453220 RepID=UPI0029C9A960|nr:hypothetical protein [Desulfogranum marinum]
MTNPLTEGMASNATNIVLRRYNLVEKYKKDPAAIIAYIHDKALSDDRRDTLYALAELSYLYGERLEKSVAVDKQVLAPDYFLVASIYAYLFLLDDRSDPASNAFDIRARTAIDLYNFGLWRGMATGDAGALKLSAVVRTLPVGTLAITVDLTKYPWKLEEFERFEPVDNYVIRGISIRNRSKGVGSALIGVKKKSQEIPFPQAVPTTIFLRINANLVELTAGTATASLEFYSAYDDNILEVKGRRAPLETDTTTPAAYVLETSQLWGLGMGAFLGNKFESIPNGLHLTQPYRPGRIPVVFVHGTFSNPAWWAEMLNTLRGDPILQQKYQFWAFLYNSSAPIVASASDLRDALKNKFTQLDPEGKDPALREMVVVGHSQGGLLTKLTVVETGDSLVYALTGKDLDSLGLPEEKKVETKRLLVVEPVPEVKRVIFISTPHRGSILSKGWVRSLIRKIVTLPAKIFDTSLSLSDYYTKDVKRIIGNSVGSTSIDGMSPDSPILKTLAATSLAPGVVGHSIIAVKGEGDPKLGNDGVVAYTSAHLDGMESEFIVRSGHSSQGHPFTIEEVRRILLEHLGTQAKPIQ